MILLTDGTVMVQYNFETSGWMRLTPDATGNYANGVWTSNPINPMSMNRLYFASQMLPSGKVWVLGGEYTGPNLDLNYAPSGEIYDPVANSWSPIAPYPNQADCPAVTVTSLGSITSGSNIITGIASTARFVDGWSVRGTAIPSGTTVTSIDTPSQVHISNPATATGTVFLTFFGQAAACFGDVPSIVLTGSPTQILAGNLRNYSTYLYNVGSNTWNFAANKVYSNDVSVEEGWVKLADNTILNYDLWETIDNLGNGIAEIYNPAANLWASKSPGDGSAIGTLPNLSSVSVDFELGPALRLQDGRVLEIGANNLTALYTASTNTWAAGPLITGTLNGVPAPFGADDAPAAILPNGHVIFAADAGAAQVTSSGNTTAGSNIITNIPSTATFQVGWAVTQNPFSTLFNVIPANTIITSVDSLTQIHISQSAGMTVTGQGLTFGGAYSAPTQLFDFDPTGGGSISPVSPAIPDANLNHIPSYFTRMLMLPTGQLLFSDNSTQLYVYTPAGDPSPVYRPVIDSVTYDGGGLFTLTGTQLNGQSAGASYGDDAQMDENYPILRFTNSTGNVYYGRTTNWSTTGVATGSTVETVDFTLNPSMPAGNYSAIVSGAGISSLPVAVNITEGVIHVSLAATYLSASCGNTSFPYGGNYGCHVSVGSNFGSPQGVITYTLDANAPVGVPLTNGIAEFSLTTPNAGAHTVVIGYAQQGNFAAAGPSTQNFTVAQAPTQVQLTPSNYYPAAGSPFTLLASVTSYSGGPPGSGLVTFLDNGTVIGTGNVNPLGQASLNIPALAAGYHSYVAQFGGLPNFAAGASGWLTISAR